MNEEQILNAELDDNLLEDLKEQIGAESTEQTKAASTAVISTFLNGLKRNASSETGRNSLLEALDRDHDGSILDDAMGFIFGKRKADNPRTTNSPGILEHIFGGKKERVAEGIGKGTGLDKSQILQIMLTLAPLILGALGRKNRNSQNAGGGGILDILRNSGLGNGSQMQGGSLLNRLLDSDDDDKGIFDDLGNLGRNAFLSRAK